MSIEVDATTASYCAAIVAGLSAAGGIIAKSVRWAARQYKDAQLWGLEVIRENTAAFNRVSELLGRVDARTADLAREQTGPVPLVQPAADTPRLRKFPRPESKPKQGG